MKAFDRDRLLTAATLVGCLGLAGVVPTPLTVLRTLGSAEAGPIGPRTLDTAALAVVGAIVWGLIGWTLLIAVLTLLARAPGAVGRIAHRVLRRVAPGFVCRVVIVGMGVSVLAGATACSTDGSPGGPRSDQPLVMMAAARMDHGVSDDRPGTATRGVPSPAAVADGRPAVDVAGAVGVAGAAADRIAGDVDLDWPVERPTGTTPRVDADVDVDVDVDWPAVVDPAPARTAPAPAPPARDATPTPTVVVVQPGDTLWDIAATQLGPGASDAQIDATWRRWFDANRAVIGSNPDHIEPGQRLHVPRTGTDTPAQDTPAQDTSAHDTPAQDTAAPPHIEEH